MQYKELEDTWKNFSELVHQLPTATDPQVSMLMKRYIEQNMLLVNEILTTSIENLHQLQHAKTPNHVICMQARLTNDINKKLSLSAQRFLNASLGHIADYNEWLKAHCDLSTD